MGCELYLSLDNMLWTDNVCSIVNDYTFFLKNQNFGLYFNLTSIKKNCKGYGKLDKTRITVRCQDAEKIKQTDGFPCKGNCDYVRAIVHINEYMKSKEC